MVWTSELISTTPHVAWFVHVTWFMFIQFLHTMHFLNHPVSISPLCFCYSRWVLPVGRTKSLTARYLAQTLQRQLRQTDATRACGWHWQAVGEETRAAWRPLDPTLSHLISLHFISYLYIALVVTLMYLAMYCHYTAVQYSITYTVSFFLTLD